MNDEPDYPLNMLNLLKFYNAVETSDAERNCNVRSCFPHEFVMELTGRSAPSVLQEVRRAVRLGFLSFTGSVKCARLTEAGREHICV